MKIIKARAILSTILIFSALLSITTGAILYFIEYGMWLCFTRKFLNDVHAVSGLIMCSAIIVHFILNRHMYVNEIKFLISKQSKYKKKVN